jgi:hypothetical protein
MHRERERERCMNHARTRTHTQAHTQTQVYNVALDSIIQKIHFKYHLSEERAAGEVMDAVLAVLQVRELCCAEDDGALRQGEQGKPGWGDARAGGE